MDRVLLISPPSVSQTRGWAIGPQSPPALHQAIGPPGREQARQSQAILPHEVISFLLPAHPRPTCLPTEIPHTAESPGPRFFPFCLSIPPHRKSLPKIPDVQCLRLASRCALSRLLFTFCLNQPPTTATRPLGSLPWNNTLCSVQDAAAAFVPNRKKRRHRRRSLLVYRNRHTPAFGLLPLVLTRYQDGSCFW